MVFDLALISFLTTSQARVAKTSFIQADCLGHEGTLLRPISLYTWLQAQRQRSNRRHHHHQGQNENLTKKLSCSSSGIRRLEYSSRGNRTVEL